MRLRQTRRISSLAAVVVAVMGVAVGVPPAAAAAPTGLVTIDNTLPRWLSHAESVATAEVAAATQMNVRVYLNPNTGLAPLQAKVASLSNPDSAEYGKWLTADQFNAAYAPTQATVDSVSSYLTSQGLTITGVEAHHRYISLSGSQANLDQAFGVTLGTYAHDGQVVTAPSHAVTLPAAVGGAVLTVTGLDTTVTTFKHDKTTFKHDSQTPDVIPPPSFLNGRPCNISYGNLLATFQADFKTPLPNFQGQTLPFALCGYTGPQLRAAYEGDTTMDGAGVTVAIVDAYRWQKIASDANTYATNHGDGAYAKGQLTESVPASFNSADACDAPGWTGEETLDVEAVHAMAPAANIRYYASSSCQDTDFLDTIARVVDENRVTLVSNSWGGVEDGESSDQIAAYEQVLLQGAAQGISFMWSSGDGGDEVAKTAIRQADYPASDPYVTGVGGTSTAIGRGGELIFQTGWGDQKYSLAPDGKSWLPEDFLYGAGGGYSVLFNRPGYQDAVVPADAPAGRAVPDVAMDADPSTGMLVGQTQTFPDGSVHFGEYRAGGTSLASPLFAGLTALAIQNGGGTGLGLLNPKLYRSKALFADVKTSPQQLGLVRVDYTNRNDPSGGLLYSVRTIGQDSSLTVTPGWDDVTGLGVPSTSYVSNFATPVSASDPG